MREIRRRTGESRERDLGRIEENKGSLHPRDESGHIFVDTEADMRDRSGDRGGVIELSKGSESGNTQVLIEDKEIRMEASDTNMSLQER
jgi:hypothetical protein